LLFSEALERAQGDENVKNLNNYFLGSMFTSMDSETVEEWTLHFYNSKSNMIRNCVVSNSEINLQKEEPAIKEMNPLDIKEVKISLDEAIGIVKADYDEKHVQTLVTLHKKENVMWSINMISAAMIITTYSIDAETGEIKNKKTTSLIQRFNSSDTK
jgi:hypothetical protein